MSILSLMEVSTTLGTTTYVVDKDTKKINKKKLKKVGTTSLVTGATTTIGEVANNNTEKKIREQSARAYIESMSDEELEKALMLLNELELPENEKECAKTL